MDATNTSTNASGLQKTPMSEGLTSLIGALLTMLGPVSLALYTPAMPALASAFQTSDAAIKMSLSLFFAGFAFAMLISGPLSDALGRRRAVVIFMTIYLAGSLACAFAPSVNFLLIGRLVQGIGASVGLTVGRAIVRDQFTGEPAARIMNMIGIMLAVGPAIAPTIGGLILVFSNWYAIFLAMVAFGVVMMAIVLTLMSETTTPDPRKAQPQALMRAYGTILRDQRFLASSFVIASSVGTLYALASILPFVLINVAGLTPSQYGVGMLMQTGLYFTGSVVFRFVLRWFSSRKLVLAGLFFIGCGATAMAISTEVLPISYLSVMLPVGCFAFGISFVLPYMTNAALFPFPKIAGSASAMMGFMQMGSGLVTGAIAAALGSPVLALQIIIPSMGVIAILSYIWLRFAERHISNPVKLENAAPENEGPIG